MRRHIGGIVVCLGTLSILGATAASAAAPALQVRVVTATPLKSGTWDPQHYIGYETAGKAQGWKIQIAETLPYGQATAEFNRWGAQGVSIVFSTDNGFEKYFLAAAAKYPKTNWVMMSDLSTLNGLKNVGSYGVDSCQQGVLVGAIAALVTKKNLIGVDTSIPILPTKKELAGMQIGINLANPKAKMLIKYTGGFVDSVKAQEVASALVQQGADVITVPTNGGTSPETAKRVEQLGVPFIGENADLSSEAPTQEVTSVVLDFTQGYAEVGKQTSTHTFVAKIRRLGLKEGFLKVLPFRTHQSIEPKIKAIEQQLTSGKINLTACDNMK